MHKFQITKFQFTFCKLNSVEFKRKVHPKGCVHSVPPPPPFPLSPVLQFGVSPKDDFFKMVFHRFLLLVVGRFLLSQDIFIIPNSEQASSSRSSILTQSLHFQISWLYIVGYRKIVWNFLENQYPRYMRVFIEKLLFVSSRLCFLSCSLVDRDGFLGHLETYETYCGTKFW